MRKSNNTLRNFIINHKAVSVASVIVLIVAVGTGIIFGINNKNTIKTEEKSSFSEQVSKNSASKSKKTDVSEVEDTSAETTVSGEEATVESTSTVSTEVVSSGAQKTTTSSSVKSNTSSKASGATSQSTASTTGGGTTSTSTGWVCPNPAAHGSADGAFCTSATRHQEKIAEYQAEQAALAKQQQYTYPAGYDMTTWCRVCNKPFGDGHNGTCNNYFEESTGKYTCHHYD